MKTGPAAPRISMRDIAKKIGVSHVTVSLALRDHPRISAAMRGRIRAAADEMGYRPDPMLTALAHYRNGKSETTTTASIAWINAETDPAETGDHRESDLYREGAGTAAAKHGYHLEEFHLGGTQTPKGLHRTLSVRGIRGLLLPPQDLPPEWGDFPWQEYSVVGLGHPLHHPRCHVVTTDHVANTMLACGKIRERGYKRIGFITDGREPLCAHLLENGDPTARHPVGAPERVPVFGMNRFQEAEQLEALRTWLENHKPDAILTQVAEVPAMLGSMGVRVPDDVALAATTVLETHIDTGIDPHPEEIGRAGFLMLHTLISDGIRGIPAVSSRLLIEGSWVDGGSLPDRG